VVLTVSSVLVAARVSVATLCHECCITGHCGAAGTLPITHSQVPYLQDLHSAHDSTGSEHAPELNVSSTAIVSGSALMCFHCVIHAACQLVHIHHCSYMHGSSCCLQVSVAVTLAAAASCLGVFSVQLLGAGLNLRCALDGALAGLVAISASKQLSPALSSVLQVQV
jgi:hypothetical protein